MCAIKEFFVFFDNWYKYILYAHRKYYNSLPIELNFNLTEIQSYPWNPWKFPWNPWNCPLNP